MRLVTLFLAAVFPLALLFAGASAHAAPKTIVIDDFERGLDPNWKEKSFRDHTRYEVVAEGNNHVLRAESRAAASGLFYEISFDPASCRTLSWRWKIDRTLPDGDERVKEGDDYAARLYVVLPSWFFPATKTLNYIWANKLPRGEHVPNPFVKNAIMIAAESGDEKAGRWVEERRDIFEDYRQVFGEDPPKAGAIALMTDTDNTGGAATGYYDDIRLECR